MFLPESREIKTCYALILKVLHIFFSWSGFDSFNNAELLAGNLAKRLFRVSTFFFSLFYLLNPFFFFFRHLILMFNSNFSITNFVFFYLQLGWLKFLIVSNHQRNLNQSKL